MSRPGLPLAETGTPVLLYGDEIGMGEDLSLPGRIAVRDPMQWAGPATIPRQGDLADLAGENQVRQVLGDREPPHRPGEEITLGRYGFRWLRLPITAERLSAIRRTLIRPLPWNFRSTCVRRVRRNRQA